MQVWRAPPIPALTIEQYLEFERQSGTKHEFFEGAMYAMTGGTLAHSVICNNLGGELRARTRGTGCVTAQSDLRLLVQQTGLLTYPDGMVICGPVQFSDNHSDTVLNPSVILEVLSPSTERHDRIFKWSQYRSIPSLREYVMVWQDEPKIERYHRRGDEWEHSALSGMPAVWRCEALGIEIPFVEIYENVTFAGQ